MNKKFLILFPCVAMVLAACGTTNTSSKVSDSSQGGSEISEPAEEVVESVDISKTAITLDIGGFEDLTAVARPGTLSDKSVTWSTDNDKVATVSTGGRVTAVGAGTAKIRATSNLDNTKFAECTVTVNSKRVFAYVYTPELNTEYVLGTFQANTAVNSMIYADANALESQRMNSVTNFNQAAKFVFEAGSASGKYHVARVKADKTKEYLNTVSGEDYHFVYAATATTDWEWDEEYCTIKTYIAGSNNNNYFPGTYNNYTTISSCSWAQIANDYVGRFYVAADVAAATSISIYPNKDLAMYAGASLDLQARIMPLGATESTVTWSSDNAKVTVENGHVVAAADATGTAKITAKVSDSVKADVTITIKEAINYGTAQNPLTVDEAMALIDKLGGKTTEQPVFVKGTVSESTYDATYKNYTIWLANATTAKAYELYRTIIDPAITEDYTAANALKGKEIVCKGFAKKYNTTYEHTNVDAGDPKNPTIISVKDAAAVNATAIALNKEKADVAQGGTLTLTATLTPANATTAVVWSVTGNEKVTVDQNGKVTVAADAVGGSTATVTATAGTVFASCVITVLAKQLNYGTLEKPLNVTEAIALLDSIEAGQMTEQEIYVKGVVSTNKAKNSYGQWEIWLKNGDVEKAFELYSAVLDASITDDYSAADSLVGKTVVCKGFAKLYVASDGSKTYECTNSKDSAGNRLNPTVISVTDTAPRSKFGTADEPLSVTEAIALLDTITAGDLTEEEIYVTGEVSTNKAKNSYGQWEIWLKNGDVAKAFELYSTVFDASITDDYSAADSLVGKTVVCKGFAKLYVASNGSKTYECTNSKDAAGNRLNPTIISVTGGSGSGTGTETGGDDAQNGLVSLVPAGLTEIDTGASGYAKYNGTRKINGYDVATSDVMQNGHDGNTTIQVKKNSGSIQIANIKATKVKLVCENAGPTAPAAANVVRVDFGGTDYSLNDAAVSAAWDAKQAAGTGYSFVLEYTINASAAGLLTISGPTSNAGYILEVVVY